jgi:hypothetical protein
MDNRDLDPTAMPPAESHPVKEQATRFSGAAKQRVLSTADEQKGRLAEQVAGFVSSVEGQGSAGARLAGWLREVQNALETRSTEDLLRSAGKKLEAHPGAFLAGCLALGFLGARLVRD